MLVAGHMGFSPDWDFGEWKVKWLIWCENNARYYWRNEPHIVDDSDRPWNLFLDSIFKPVEHLLKHRHCNLTSTETGVVIYIEWVQNQHTAVQCAMQSKDINLDVKSFSGLNAAWQW